MENILPHPPTWDEIDARITERILMYDRKLRMDGCIVESERPQQGTTAAKSHRPDTQPSPVKDSQL